MRSLGDKSAVPAASPEPQADIRVETRGPNLQFWSAKGFEWTHVELPIPELPVELEGLRILHLSDIHARGRWDDAYDQLIERVRRSAPDIILFTGDFLDCKRDYRPGFPFAKRLVNQLHARLGFFAVLGNHDRALSVEVLRELNVTLAGFRPITVAAGSASLEIIGLGGVERLDDVPPVLKSLTPKTPHSMRIVLSHYPDNLRKTAFLDPDLFLSGHTHGGQICLPKRIPIIKHDSLPRRFCSGIHRGYGTWVVINRGFGYSSHLPLRILCPAEVIEIKLKRVNV